MRGYILFLIIGLLFLAGCNNGDSSTGRTIQEVQEVNNPTPEPEPVAETPKEEVVQPKIQTPKIKEEKLEVHFIDVGYGDAILFKKNKDTILVDCGRSDEPIFNYLNKLKISDVDLLITSIPLKEHVGGCDRVLRNLVVHKVMDNGRSPHDEVFEEYLTYRGESSYNVIKKGDKMNIGDIQITVLGANNRIEKENSNPVILKVSYGDIDFLLSSDCNEECENKLPLGMQSEIFKVSNHGSLLSNSYEFISKVSPEVSIISVSADNQYKNPKQALLDRLSETDIYRTDLHGTIIVTTDGKTYDVKIEK